MSEELESKIEKLEEHIETLEEENQELKYLVEEAEEQRGETDTELSRLREFEEDKEEFAERCFNGGFESCENGESQLKGWLNFKVGERL